MSFYHVKAATSSGIASTAEEGIPAKSAVEAEELMRQSVYGKEFTPNKGSIIAQIIPTYHDFENHAKLANGTGFLVYHRTIGFMTSTDGMDPNDKDFVIQYDLKSKPIDICLETFEAILLFAVERDFFA